MSWIDKAHRLSLIHILMSDKIHIPAIKPKINQQGVIKITDEALEALSEVMVETGMSCLLYTSRCV